MRKVELAVLELLELLERAPASETEIGNSLRGRFKFVRVRVFFARMTLEKGHLIRAKRFATAYLEPQYSITVTGHSVLMGIRA